MTLLFLTPGGMFADRSGRVGLPAKTLSALAEYSKRWDGEVVASSMEMPQFALDSTAGLTWDEDAARVGVRFIRQIHTDKQVSEISPRVVQIQTTAPGLERVFKWGVPLLLTDDNAPAVRTDITLLGMEGALGRLRVRVGAVRRQARINRYVRRADGFQCNGFAAGAYYSRIRSDALRFFDHRITAEDVSESVGRTPARSSTLRLGFSGRLVGIKGVELLPRIAEHLDAVGLDYSFVVYGEGPLMDELRSGHFAERATLRGFVAFDPEWKELVRDEVDLMVLPHLQGDSSSTYFEAIGMGIPVLGFRNATLTPFVAETGAGWAVPMGDLEAMATRICSLNERRDELDIARIRGLEFMQRHTMEAEFDLRLEHMRGLARS